MFDRDWKYDEGFAQGVLRNRECSVFVAAQGCFVTVFLRPVLPASEVMKCLPHSYYLCYTATGENRCGNVCRSHLAFQERHFIKKKYTGI